MFDSIGWPEILVLAVVGLFVLGPERMPQGAAWLGRNLRRVRSYAQGAREQLRNELGAQEYEEIRKPLEELRSIKNFNPRTAVTQHLLDGDNPLDGYGKPADYLSAPSSTTGTGHTPQQIDPVPAPKPATPQGPLSPGEKPPYDSDAT